MLLFSRAFRMTGFKSPSIGKMVVSGSNNFFVANFATRSRKFDAIRARLPAPEPQQEMPIDIDEFIKNIDTTLTPEQREKVEKLKRQIRGGPNQPRSFHRDVPTRAEYDEMEFDTLPTKFTDKAQDLIDYALSFVPDRAGPRRSRYKKRMAARWQQSKNDHKRRKEQTHAAHQRKRALTRRQVDLVRLYKAEAGIAMNNWREEQTGASTDV